MMLDQSTEFMQTAIASLIDAFYLIRSQTEDPAKVKEIEEKLQIKVDEVVKFQCQVKDLSEEISSLKEANPLADKVQLKSLQSDLSSYQAEIMKLKGEDIDGMPESVKELVGRFMNVLKKAEIIMYGLEE